MDSIAVLPCRALLFDCDGVLVDSDDTVARSWTRWALRYGLDPADVSRQVHGRRSVDTVASLIAPERQAEAVRVIDAYELEDARAVRSVAGAPALVASLPPGSWAVVTSGTAALARARLEAAGIPAPRVMITADDVTRGNPDPQGYLAAACGLGVSPTAAGVRSSNPRLGRAQARSSTKRRAVRSVQPSGQPPARAGLRSACRDRAPPVGRRPAWRSAQCPRRRG